MQTQNRPIFWISLYYSIGIIGGYIGQKEPYISLLVFYGVAVLGVLALAYYFKAYQWLLLIVVLSVGVTMYIKHPLNNEKMFLSEKMTFKGLITEKQVNLYNTTYTVKDVVVWHNKKEKHLQSALQLVMKEGELVVGDKVEGVGELKDEKEQMNPSDWDYKMYLKGEGILATIKGSHVKKVGHVETILKQTKQHLIDRIDLVFQKDQYEVVKGLVLGEKIQGEKLLQIYYDLGIGHLLVISGMHMVIIYIGVWWGLGKLKVTYNLRGVLSLLGVWSYVLLIGSGTSAVRGSLIISIVVVGKILWQEADEWISIALAALIMLLYNPFQLFSVGFQLSFLAFIGVIVCEKCISQIQQRHIDKTTFKVIKATIYTLGITIVSWPVLAWHFYKIPLLGTLLNFLYVPLFSALLPIIIVNVIISYLSLALAQGLGSVIVWLLQACHHFAFAFNELPYVTKVVGKPNWLYIGAYYTLGALIYFRYIRIKNSIDKKVLEYMLLGIIVALIFGGYKEKQLEVMHLYVGQGDAAVVITPNQRAIVVDVGQAGKEEIVWRYLTYRGIDEIEYLIVSHPHADHIGGVIEMVKKNKKIGGIIVAENAEENTLSMELLALCKKRGIPYYRVGGNEQLRIDNVDVDFLPNKLRTADANNGSMVIRMTYGEYTQLFTGDIEKERETTLLELDDTITVLKVAHHGSNTSTSNEFLERVRPKYGMISCGIANRYNHPSQEVTQRLDTMGVDTKVTAKDGAVLFKTDGKQMSVVTHLQEDKHGNTGD